MQVLVEFLIYCPFGLTNKIRENHLLCDARNKDKDKKTPLQANQWWKQEGIRDESVLHEEGIT